jgi:DNA-binding NarL/FixJ family response regulator
MRLDDLAPREREIACLVGEGLTHKEIAALLPNRRARSGYVTFRTVQKTIRRIADKLPDDGRTPHYRVMPWVLLQQAA